MCGIYGEVSLNQTIDYLRIKKNLQLLDHRGPDDEGIWINDDRKIAFGFKRLSIIDLSKRGNQPMIDSSNNYVIIFNGEIYNFKKLKKQLQKKGHQFKSISDTEVLLKAYIEWPNEFILKIEGMFSIAIFDKKQKKIILARDLAGQKPLYYYHSESEFKFSSELKPIINSHEDKNLCQVGINNFFKYGFSGIENTLIDGFKKVNPGELLEFNLDTWKLLSKPTNMLQDKDKIQKNNFIEDIDKLAFKLIDLLNESIESQLYADVDVGVMLSGGLDSSIITALASKIKPSLMTFSAVFPNDKSVDESRHSRFIADFFKTNHYELPITEVKPHFLEQLIYYYDDPLGTPSFIPTYLISRAIRNHCKVVLGGDGADELFGGYFPYSRIQKWNVSSKNLFNTFYFEPKKLISFIENSNIRGKGFLLNALKDTKKLNHTMVQWFSNSEREKMLGKQALQKYSREFKQIYSGSVYLRDQNDELNRIMFGDFKSFLLEDVLKKVDRSSMANSLEVRAPYLDTNIIDFAFNNIPSAYKVKKNNRKIILQKVGSLLLPKEHDLKRKQGFSFPINSYFMRDDWQSFFFDKLDCSGGIINKIFAKKLVQKHKKNRSEGLRLFTILIFLLWHERFIQQKI